MADVDRQSSPRVSAAPPTEPGAMGRAEALPASRWAVASLACAVIGLLLAPLAFTAIGLGVVGLRRIAAPDSKRQGRGLALAGIWTGVCGVLLLPVYGLMLWAVFSAVAGAGRMEAVQDLRLVHEQALIFGESNGRYPVHPAEILVDTQGGFEAHRRVRGHELTGNVEPDVLLGSYDFADFDDSARSFRAVVAALERIDESEAIYAFGDCWFARLDRPRSDADLVFGWWPDPSGGPVQMVMDDGSVRETSRDEWSSLWAADAAARSEAGLATLLEQPAYP